MIKKLVLTGKIICLVLLAFNCQFSKVVATTATPANRILANNRSVSAAKKDNLYIPGLNNNVLKLAMKAYKKTRAMGLNEKEILTIVDYSMPSSTPRLWVINMSDNKLLYHTHVAHGIGSGDNFATKFSNRHGSKMSSIGVYLTTNIYDGHYGKSLNLIGLEENFNSNAEARRIVVHKAHYVDEMIVKKIGRLGRSFGCLALNSKVAEKIIHTIKNGSLIFCYYPDQKWLNESKFL